MVLLLIICAPAPARAANARRALDDSREVESFFDTLIRERMVRDGTPGVVISLVKDGEVFFAKGYGYADLEAKRPVVPDRTIFRVGPITELFTATAVMTLVEQGRIRLDDDVNRYLPSFQIPESFRAPVTVANLLTHSGGFEEQLAGTGARRREELLSLEQYLSRRMPPRVFRPGDLICHSSQGYTLLGYLVEVVSGMPFGQYVEQNILKPLGMNRSGFSTPARESPDLAPGYEPLRGYFQRTPYIYLNISPSAGLEATAIDMAHFMSAHLQGGSYHDGRILSEESVWEMQRQHFSNHPRLPGLTWGFFETFYFNSHGLYHAGGLRGYGSLLCLMPDQKIGIFVADNGSQQDDVWFVVDSFIKHYYPPTPLAVNLSPDMIDRVRPFTGSFEHVRHSQRTIEKLITLRSGQVYVSANEDGTLNIYGGRFAEIGPSTFRRVDGYELAAFREDDAGRVTHMFFDQEAHQKLAWYETSFCQQLLGVLIVLSFLLSFLGWSDQGPDWKPDRSSDTGGRPASVARRLAQLVSLLNLTFLVGIAAIFGSTADGDVWFGFPRILAVLLCLPFLSLCLALALAVAAFVAWCRGYWSFRKRVQFSLITAGALAFIAYLHHWNLLGFHY
jgi:CubicO group peptidase (beta-lactamase class C family)